MSIEHDRRKSIDLALARMDKPFGNAVFPLIPIAAISSGSSSLDAALGVGGFPRGRVIEIYGAESSGKTTIALQAIAQAQRVGGSAAFIDAEHALDPLYAKRLGVDIDNLLVSRPEHGEQALEIAGALIGSGAVAVVVIDSVAALVPKFEAESDMGDVHVGMHARLMSQALRKLAGMAAKTGTCLIFINQIRERFGSEYGNPEVTTGGRALNMYSSVRLEIRSMGSIKEGEVIIGNRTTVKVVKNRCAQPFREAEFDLLYGIGTSREGGLSRDAGVGGAQTRAQQG